MFKIITSFATEDMGKKGVFRCVQVKNHYITGRGVLRKVNILNHGRRKGALSPPGFSNVSKKGCFLSFK